MKRYIPEGYTQPASRSGTGTHMAECKDGDYVLASDYDALAQRCRDLEACIAGDHTNLVALLRVGQAKAERERDALCSEVERRERQRVILCGDKDRLIDMCKERDDRVNALRAEIELLRNPSDDMLVAGQEVWARGRISALEDCEEARAIYMAMIDAAMEAPR